MIRLLASSLIAATLVAAAPAVAEDAAAPTRTVTYADLDLTTPAGQHTLDQRVLGAIRAICPEPEAASMDAILDYQRCRVAAKLSARTQVATVVDKAVRLALHDDGAIRLASR